MEKRATFRSPLTGLAFAAPMLLLIFVFFYWPAAQALLWSFTLQQPWGGGGRWVGFGNFRDLLADPVYWSAVLRSLVFAIAATGLALAIALGLALLTDRERYGHRLFRAVLIWPYAFPAPALGLAFRFILAPEAGLLAILNRLWPGCWNPAFNGTDAMVAITLTFAWKYIGYNFIFLLAALQAIPRPLIEAAALDGAGPMSRMRDIQLPLLLPTLFFLVVMNITESFQDSFGLIDVMSGGGPARATELMVYKIYFDGFKGFDYSGAAAQSMILMALVVVLTIVQFRFIERRIQYR